MPSPSVRSGRALARRSDELRCELGELGHQWRACELRGDGTCRDDVMNGTRRVVRPGKLSTQLIQGPSTDRRAPSQQQLSTKTSLVAATSSGHSPLGVRMRCSPQGVAEEGSLRVSRSSRNDGSHAASEPLAPPVAAVKLPQPVPAARDSRGVGCVSRRLSASPVMSQLPPPSPDLRPSVVGARVSGRRTSVRC